MEMPRYLLQEDEAVAEESTAEKSGCGDPKASVSSQPCSALNAGVTEQTVGCEYLHDNSLSSSQFRHPHKATESIHFHADQRLSNSDVSTPLQGSMTVGCPLPQAHQMLHSGQVLSLNAIPINIATSSGRNIIMNERKKYRHGGGWPKGKSRKVKGELSPPKPPSTG